MIGIVHIGNVLVEPYYQKYKSALDSVGAEYECILWDRQSKLDGKDGFHVFKTQKEPKGKIEKLLAYKKYSAFVKKIVKQKKYDKLILLTTMSALVLGKILKKYKGRYIFDLRDLSFEKNPIFRKKVIRIIENSAFSAISSDGFRDVYLNCDTVRAHNLSGEENQVQTKQKKQNGKINVAYIGISRGEKFNKRLIDIFGGDDRFLLTIAGKNVDSKNIVEYAKTKQNVTIIGEYNGEQKSKLLFEADMLINMNTASFNGKRLTANKYYDGLLYLLPQIARVDEYTGALLTCKELGVALDFLDEDFSNKVYEYYQNLDMEEYTKRAKLELEKAKEQNQIFTQKIVEFAKK